MKRWLSVGIVLAILAAPGTLEAQATGPVILRLPGSPRGPSLGDALVAMRGSDAVFSTPATISLNSGTALSVSRFGSASTLGTLATSTQIGRVGLAAGVQWLEFPFDDTVLEYTPGLLVSADGTSATDLAAMGALSYPIKGFLTGVAVRYVEERVAEDYAGSVTFDAGVFRNLGNLDVGLAVQNLGQDLESAAGRESPLPTRVTLGATLPRVMVGTFFDLAATAAIGWERSWGVTAGGGVELSYLPLEGYGFSLRAGIRRVSTEQDPHPWPLAVGATFGLDQFRIDYGFEPSVGGSTVHRLGLRIQ